MKIRENVSLDAYTTFEIGGAARYFVDVYSAPDIVNAITYAHEKKCPYYILGGGSNVLVADSGYDGLVIRMAMEGCDIVGTHVTVQAGHNLLAFLRALAAEGLGGMEDLAGIPGSVGGAVRGNAGAFGQEISDVITSVRALNIETGAVEEFSHGRCAYAYRTSYFKSRTDLIILDATFEMTAAPESDITQKMHATIAQREKRHIQDIKSAGSFFMNPEVSVELQHDFTHDKGVQSRGGRVPAGWLLERAELSTKRIGDIQAGEMHANYFINVGKGTAEQVVQLASLAKTRVRDEYGVHLQEEVQLVGF